MQVTADLNFNGGCEGAFKYFEERLGGNIEIVSTFEGAPAAKQAPAHADRFCHAKG